MRDYAKGNAGAIGESLHNKIKLVYTLPAFLNTPPKLARNKNNHTPKNISYEYMVQWILEKVGRRFRDYE